MFRRFVLPWLAWILYRSWSATWRLDRHEPAALTEAAARGEPLVFAHWHGQELCILPLITPWRIATMTSTSKDGALVDFAVRRLGGMTSRGSSTRGGIGALKGLVRLLGQGYNASMAVDGPKGPLHQVKPGVFELARLGKARIVPFGAACSREYIFRKSWNRAQLPLPFARVSVVFGQPWDLIERGADLRGPELKTRLEREIREACQASEEHLP